MQLRARSNSVDNLLIECAQFFLNSCNYRIRRRFHFARSKAPAFVTRNVDTLETEVSRLLNKVSSKLAARLDLDQKLKRSTNSSPKTPL